MNKQNSWQRQLVEAVSSVDELLSLLGLSAEDIGLEHHDFPLRVPRAFISRMRKGDPTDPLLLQILPQASELLTVPGFDLDPLEEQRANPVPGLLHKFKSRVLLTVAAACAVHCRYCFRRHFPYADNTPGLQGWQQAIDYIAADPAIVEVIYSGGDPLVAKDEYLSILTDKIAEIGHVQYLRIHTRLPVVLPARVSDEMISWLTGSRLKPVVVIHCNHPNEIDAAVAEALEKLRQAGIMLYNQSVLLAGVNDNVETLVALSHRLFAHGVTPYYLHRLDKVHGAAHFDVSLARIREIMWGLQSELPGYLLPKLVQEVPGAAAKMSIQCG